MEIVCGCADELDGAFREAFVLSNLFQECLPLVQIPMIE
jgi:hypothetical protein